jgi:hypothetical protein
MPEPQPQPILEIDLGENGDRLSFKTFEGLRRWNNNERSHWVWMREAGRPMTDWAVSSQDEFYNQIEQFASQWQRVVQNPQEVNNVFGSIRNIFDQYIFKKRRLIFSTNPAASFIQALREKRGDRVAAGAYAGILSAQINTGGQTQSDFFEGIVEAFLFKREVDWTAKANQQAFNRLKGKYDEEIARQDARFQQLEEKNRLLNEAFDAALKEKTESLVRLHEGQTADYAKLTEKHVQNLAAIEKAYDQKLALQKPVKYWQTKERYHSIRSIVYGIVALVSGILAAGGLGFLAYDYLGKLSDTENPKHWQIGLLVVGAFFAVWLVRVFVRLFFSNVHLATDAAERRMMILTYLAMSREGAQFGAEDKKLIIQHIFRAASDGLVKDDAAPPTLFELLSRK